MGKIRPRVPGQYDQEEKARNRDIVLRWLEGQGVAKVAELYHLPPEAVSEIIDSAEGKRLREEVRQRAIDYTLERFDTSAPESLEMLVRLRDQSGDEKMQRLAALDILEYSSLKKAKEADSNIGADLIRGIAKLAKEAVVDGK